jgi:hypothetical protein
MCPALRAGRRRLGECSVMSPEPAYGLARRGEGTASLSARRTVLVEARLSQDSAFELQTASAHDPSE